MLRLDSTLRSLQAKLGGAVTTNELPIMVSYSDKTATTYDGNTQLSVTTGATAVTIASAPGAAGIVRDIDYVSVWNRDTVSATVSIIYNDNGTPQTIVQVTLASGDQLVYVHGDGWKTIDKFGNEKTVVASTVTLPANRAVITDGSGALTTSSTTDTEIGYVNGVTSSIQTQLNGKQPLDSDLSALAAIATTGIYVIAGAGTSATRTIQPTANQISVANGDGIAGDPTISITTNPLIPGYIRLLEISPPGAAAVNELRFYADNYATKTIPTIVTSDDIAMGLAQDNYIVGRNATGITIPKGTPVYVSGIQGSNRPRVSPAQADANVSSYVVGVMGEDTLDGTDGRVMYSGLMEGVDTSAFTEGDAVYLSATVAGGLQNTVPAYPALWVRVGIVLTAAVNGRLLVQASFLRRTLDATISPSFTIGPSLTNNIILDVGGSSLTGSRTLTFQDASGTVAYLSNLSGYQPLDSDLTALAATATTGLYVVTGVGTSATRTIQPTANQISVSNGDGVGGDPTLSLPSVLIAPGSVQATSNFIAGTATNSFTTTTGTSLTLTPGAAATVTSVGNTITIIGGAGGSTSGAGGATFLTGGVPTDGNGGAVAITAAAGVGTNRNGGNVTITAGNKTGSGTDGVINLVIPATGTLQINSAAGSSGQVLTSNGPTAAPTWQPVSAGSVRLDQILAATTGASINNGDNTIDWNWQLTTAAKSAFGITETAASTGGAGAQFLFDVGTLAASTANPIRIQAQGNNILTVTNVGVTTLQGADTGTGSAITLRGGNSSTAATVGGSVTIQGGTGSTTGNGGALSITAGTGGATGNGGLTTIAGGAGASGGAVLVQGGTASNGGGGNVTLLGSNGTGTNMSGGTALVQGGTSTGTAAGGSVSITGGGTFSSGVGGSVTIVAGTGGGASSGGAINFAGGTGGLTGTGGTAILQGGPGGTTSGDGGAATVFGGTATNGNGGAANLRGRDGIGTNRSGGSVTITAGARTGTGTAGVINLVIPATGELQINGAGGIAGQVLTSNGPAVAPTWQTSGGGGASAPANEIVFGTGASVSSDPDFTYAAATGAFLVNTTNGTSGSVSVAAPGAVGIFGGNATGTGVASSVTIAGGTAAGAGTGGTVTIAAGTTTGGTNGTVIVQTGGAQQGQWTATGSFILGNATLATTATDGFLYIAACSGTPTGNPTNVSGRVPFIVDQDNDVLYTAANPNAANEWRPVSSQKSRHVANWADDFAISGVANQTIGELRWSMTQSVAATNTIQATVTDHPGIIRLVTAGTSGNNTRIHFNGTTAGSSVMANQLAEFTWIVSIPTITSIIVKVGLCQDASVGTAAQWGTNGVWFEFSTAANANWRCYTRSGGTSSTPLNTGVVVTAGNWYVLRAVRNGTTNWEFFVNGTSVGTIATNLPTTAVNVGAIVQTATGAARNLDVDYFRAVTEVMGNRFT